jgi:hypothetical protein
MSEPEDRADPLMDLIDDYLDGRLDEARTQQLEARLRDDAEARRFFVRYARLHTDLHLEARARQAGERALDRLFADEAGPHPARHLAVASHRLRVALAAAACLLLAAGAAWWFMQGPSEGGHEAAVAWLVNAQDCEWAEGEPAGDMQAGRILRLQRGLAEIRFQCGSRVVLEGPAGLELLSGRSARLLHGKLTARVPGPATGFEILSPQGKVVDLGTEFGLAVADSGATDVYVFEGKVQAHPDNEAGAVYLTRDQAARIADGKVVVQADRATTDAARFVRAIVPPPRIVPRVLRLTFDRASDGSLRDAAGLGTGLTHRLPGTGGALPLQDPNLRLDPAQQRLELTTTDSDLNRQFQLDHGEYLGMRLADLGFTGKEDFAVTTTIPNIPALQFIGQFGLYAGVRSDRNIRGGVIGRREPGQYRQFLVNNDAGRDRDLGLIGLLTTGTDLRLTLKRIDGKYTLVVENLTAGSSSALTIRHPAFLDNERDMYVGLFGANTHSDVRKTLLVKELEVTVWTVTSSAPAAR